MAEPDGALTCLRFRPGLGWTIEGWAVDPGTPDRPLVVEMAVAGSRLDALANVHDPSGVWCFTATLPATWIPDGPQVRCSLTIPARNGRVVRDMPVPVEPLCGWVDGIAGATVDGWACNAAVPEMPLAIDVLSQGILVDRIVADRRRDDLNRVGLGRCAFRWVVPEALMDGRAREISFRVANSRRLLPVPPLVLSQFRERLPAELRRLIHLRRFALADSSGVAMPLPVDDPVTSHARALEARTAALWRWESVDVRPEVPAGSPETGLSQRDLLLLGVNDTAALTVSGGVVSAAGGFVRGWVSRPPALPALVEVLVDGHTAGLVTAMPPDRNGPCAFSLPLGEEALDGSTHDITARLANTCTVLPLSVTCRLEVDRDAATTMASAPAMAAARRRVSVLDEQILAQVATMQTTEPQVSDLPLDAAGIFADLLPPRPARPAGGR